MIYDDFWNFIDGQNISRKAVTSLLEESESIIEYVNRSLMGNDYWQISEDEIRVMYSIIKLKGPKTVIETGVGSGVSTTTILRASPKDAKLISIDPMIKYGKGDREVGFLIPKEEKNKLLILKGKSSEKLNEALEIAGKLDIFFHDSEHSYDNVMFELKTVLPYISGSSLIIVDNYDWTEAPKDFAENNRLKLLKIADDMALIVNPAYSRL